MAWWANPSATHAPTLLAGGLVDVDGTAGLYRSWELTDDRQGRPALPCGSGAAGGFSTGTTLSAMDESYIEYQPATGAWRVLGCPALSLREGLPSTACRKLGFGTWPTGREILYLGRGRVMAWERATMRFDVWSLMTRVHDHGRVFSNASAHPLFEPRERGFLAGVSNESTLLHVRLPLAVEWQPDNAPPQPRDVHVVLEVLPRDRSYRVWNSEGWAPYAPRGAGDSRRAPLAGPVGRGYFPSAFWPVARGGSDESGKSKSCNGFLGLHDGSPFIWCFPSSPMRTCAPECRRLRCHKEIRSGTAIGQSPPITRS